MKLFTRYWVGVGLVVVGLSTMGTGCPPDSVTTPVEIAGNVTVSYPADGLGAQVLVTLPDATGGTVTIRCENGESYTTQLVVDPGQWHIRTYWVLGAAGPCYVVGVGGYFDVALGKAVEKDDKAALFGAVLIIPWFEEPAFDPYALFVNVPFGDCCTVEFNGTTHGDKPAHWSEEFCTEPGPWAWQCWPPEDDYRMDGSVLRLSRQHDDAGNNAANVWGLADVFAGEPQYSVGDLLIEFDLDGLGYTGGDNGDYFMPVALDDPDGFSYRGTTPTCELGTRGSAYCWVYTQFGWHRSEQHRFVITDDLPVLTKPEWQDWVDDWRSSHGYASINWNDHKDHPAN